MALCPNALHTRRYGGEEGNHRRTLTHGL
jgi:hypothetical protein